ncbi:MAG: aminoglycoside phosphotransferase family protein [Candidatus Uhrbacteria bacterium]|nr:aminoglycoside phosphotransferase family protein [Candidatus Uhrbacteria bacterium]
MIPKKVLTAFGFDQNASSKQLSSGLIHQTYLIKNDRKQYIIQRLHPVLATPEIANDFLSVTKYLHKEKFLAPECVLSKKGEVLVDDGKWKWRAQTFVSGKTVHLLKDIKMAKEAGEVYARFHETMAIVPYEFQSKKVSHDTEKIFETFRHTVDVYRDSERMLDVIHDVVFLLEQTPKYFLPKSLPLRVIHGDPKISNILFDASGKAKSIVDLDTCNRRPILVELGDAFRSWCGGREDDVKNVFSIPMFRAAWKGYASNATFLTKIERKYVGKAIGTITLELACRFMTDYFVDDYFGWDPSRYSSRRAHNLARAKGQIAEFKDYLKKREIIEKIVHKDA